MKKRISRGWATSVCLICSILLGAILVQATPDDGVCDKEEELVETLQDELESLEEWQKQHADAAQMYREAIAANWKSWWECLRDQLAKKIELAVILVRIAEIENELAKNAGSLFLVLPMVDEIWDGITSGTTDGARLAEEKLKELKKKKAVEDSIAWYDSMMADIMSLINGQKCDLADEEAWVQSYQNWIATAEADLANALAALNSCRAQAGLPPL